jgi:hypothetical protein
VPARSGRDPEGTFQLGFECRLGVGLLRTFKLPRRSLTPSFTAPIRRDRYNRDIVRLRRASKCTPSSKSAGKEHLGAARSAKESRAPCNPCGDSLFWQCQPAPESCARAEQTGVTAIERRRAADSLKLEWPLSRGSPSLALRRTAGVDPQQPFRKQRTGPICGWYSPAWGDCSVAS